MTTIHDEEKREYAEEMLLILGCPYCGAEVNQEYVYNVIDNIISKVRQKTIDDCIACVPEQRSLKNPVDSMGRVLPPTELFERRADLEWNRCTYETIANLKELKK